MYLRILRVSSSLLIKSGVLSNLIDILLTYSGVLLIEWCIFDFEWYIVNLHWCILYCRPESGVLLTWSGILLT